MAITNAVLIQDNFIGNVNLLAVHSPVVFILRVSFTGTPPDLFYATIGQLEYKLIYLRDFSATERDFVLIADEPLRLELPELVDSPQSGNTVISIAELTKDVIIEFYENSPWVEITVMACHAARDFTSTNGITLFELWNNEQNYYIGAVGQSVYAYWFNNNISNIIGGVKDIDIGIDTPTTAANIVTALATKYPDWISETPNDKIIFAYVSGAATVTLDSQLGAILTFSNIVVGASMSFSITGNGSALAQLKIMINTVPVDGEDLNFDFDSSNTIMPPGGVSVVEHLGIKGGGTYPVGFVRKKFTPSIIGEQDISLNIAGVDYVHKINVHDWCDENIMLKFVDRSGQYRFLPLSMFYSVSETPKKIGEINNFVLSIKDDKSDKQIIGYKNNKTINASTPMLNKTEIKILEGLYNSPEISLLINNKWVGVEVDGDKITKLQKRNFAEINISIILPASYNITKL